MQAKRPIGSFVIHILLLIWTWKWFHVNQLNYWEFITSIKMFLIVVGNRVVKCWNPSPKTISFLFWVILRKPLESLKKSMEAEFSQIIFFYLSNRSHDHIEQLGQTYEACEDRPSHARSKCVKPSTNAKHGIETCINKYLLTQFTPIFDSLPTTCLVSWNGKYAQ